MHQGFDLKITEVVNDSSEMVDAERVYFEIEEGDPSRKEVINFVEHSGLSICHVQFDCESRRGSFIDLNFEFKENQILHCELTPH